jgi:hypothetical protein
MFRMLVLQALNNLSDEQVEYQVRDRLSFSRFLGLAIEDSIPDATTLWLFREKVAKAGRGGQIIDASIVPTQRNSRDENGEPAQTADRVAFKAPIDSAHTAPQVP